MKKLRMMALLAVLCLLLSVPAMAAGPVAENSKIRVTTVDGVGASVAFDESNEEAIQLTVSSEQLTAGEQYLVLMVKSADGETYSITEDSILYIDQTAAVAGSPYASVQFQIVPSSLENSVILISGTDGLLKAAIVEGKYILGDVDRNGIVNTSDATALLRYMAGLVSEESIDMSAADVDANQIVNTSDATKLLRVFAGIETLQ